MKPGRQNDKISLRRDGPAVRQWYAWCEAIDAVELSLDFESR